MVVRDAVGGLFATFLNDGRPLAGRSFGTVVPPRLYPMFVDHVAGAFRGERSTVVVQGATASHMIELTFSPPTAEGADRWCGIAALDVSSEHEAQSVAAELAAVLDGTIVAAPIATALTSATGTWLRVNTALEHLLGFRETELTGKTVADLTVVDDNTREAHLAARAMRTGEQFYELEKRMIAADGAVIAVLCRTTPIRDTQTLRGNVVHLIPSSAADTLHGPRRRGRQLRARGH